MSLYDEIEYVGRENDLICETVVVSLKDLMFLLIIFIFDEIFSIDGDCIEVVEVIKSLLLFSLIGFIFSLFS